MDLDPKTYEVCIEERTDEMHGALCLSLVVFKRPGSEKVRHFCFDSITNHVQQTNKPAVSTTLYYIQ